MSRNPKIVAAAHKELDAVVGPDRLPVIEDRPNLPYIEAILTESLRYGAPAPLGVPHKSMADDVYNGYFIKKGTTIISNIWYPPFASITLWLLT
jgi:cytochrome P450